MSNTIWILILYFVISAIGGILSRRQQKARRATPPQRDRDPFGNAPAAPPAGNTPPPARRQTPEEIAAEIRRIMGLEREEAKVEVVEDVYQEPVTSPRYSFDPDREGADREEPDHGGHLRNRIGAREAAARQLGAGIDARHLESDIGHRFDALTLGSLRGRYAAVASSPRDARVHRVRGRGRGSAYVDIADMARALVTMEVLGPPKALREERF